MEDTEEKNDELVAGKEEKEENGFCSKNTIALIIIVCFLLSIGLVILAIIIYLARDYKLSPLEVYEKYNKIENISVGDNGVVYKAKNKNTSEIVSIKEIKLSTTKIRDEVKNDILFTKAIHKYTNKSIEIKELFEERSTKFIVTEYYDKDLFIVLNEIKGTEGFDVSTIKNIMIQLNEVLNILRQKNIVHHNIKLESILVQMNNNSTIENNFEIRLSNYSQAKLLTNNSKEWEEIKPYKDYKKEELTILEKQDLLDIGKEIYHMYFKNKIIDKDKIKKDINDEDLKDLLNKLLEDDYNKRIEWNDYFAHKFFNIDNDTLVDN